MTSIYSTDPQNLVSARLNQQPGLSGFGALVHLARLNHFGGRDFPAAFGLRFQYREDLSHLLTFSDKRQAAMGAVAGSGAAGVAWGVEPWQPFVSDKLWEHLPWSLRVCTTCLHFGYHSNLFQMPWIQCCPWHGERLIEQCRKCGQALLDGFRRGRRLMQCVCDIDYVDELAVLKGDPASALARQSFVEWYLGWAKASRSSTTLLCPEEFDALGKDALSTLVGIADVPDRWRSCFSGGLTTVHLEIINRAVAANAPSEGDFTAMVKCANSLWLGQPGMAELPRRFLEPLIATTRQVAAPVPDTALTCREREAMALEPVDTAATARSRQELIFLPLQKVTSGLYLDARVLHRTAYRLITNLAWELLNNDPSREHPTSGSHQLLMSAIQRTLVRAYADGMKHVLGRHVPAIFDHPRIKPGPRMPWALLKRDALGAQQIKLAWTLRRPWSEAFDRSTSAKGAR